MQTLTVTREYKGHLNCVTTLRNENGFVKAILTGYKQPNKGQKTIVVNKQVFNLKF